MGSNLVSIEQGKINNNFNIKGFSLVELVVVITVIAILAAIAVPLYKGVTDRVKKAVCDANCLQLEKMYEVWLVLENKKHVDELFINYREEYGQKICPDGSDVSYRKSDGRVKCIVHSVDDGSGNGGNDDEGVPYL